MAKSTTLKAAKPERVIALLGGAFNTGKSFFCANIPNAFIFDTDLGGGLSAYDARIERNGSERIEVGSYLDVQRVLKERRKDMAKVNTLVIDHLTTLQQESTHRHNPTGADDYGKSYTRATREWQQIRNFARTFDFNLVCTAHMKSQYKDGKIVGLTSDASKNVEADFMIVLYLEKLPRPPHQAHVAKWRRDPDDARGPVPDEFPLTLAGFLEIHGFPLDYAREETEMASHDQIEALIRLRDTIKLPDDKMGQWLASASYDDMSEMTAEQIAKATAYCNELIRKAASGK